MDKIEIKEYKIWMDFFIRRFCTSKGKRKNADYDDLISAGMEGLSTALSKNITVRDEIQKYIQREIHKEYHKQSKINKIPSFSLDENFLHEDGCETDYHGNYPQLRTTTVEEDFFKELDELEMNKNLQYIGALMNCLTPSERKVIALHFYKKISIKKIAKLLSVKSCTVSILKTNGIQRMKKFSKSLHFRSLLKANYSQL